MEMEWLEDFISLAETHSFSRSAEARHITQPAFSRRIRSLESWLGADLIDRTSYPTHLTPAGEVFYEQAVKMLGQISGTRALLRGQQPTRRDTITFATPHTLSLTYFPKWLAEIEKGFGIVNTRLLVGNVHDAVMALVEGGCDLLLCYHHPRRPVQLNKRHYEVLVLGKEAMLPCARCNRAGEPLYRLPGTPQAPVPFLSYSSNAYFSRMVELILTDNPGLLHLETRYETDMAECLKAMALQGHGVAFLPESAVVRERKNRQLALAGDRRFSTEMDILLCRPRHSTKTIVDRLWRHVLPRYTSRRQSVPS
jgi:DNA-binding transcriptional LysR family regulator